jgi:hypothetical protein
MILVVALLAYFCLIGLITRRFDTRTRWLLMVGVVALVLVDFARRALP